MRCCCAGESFFRLIYPNETREAVAMAISPKWPSKMLPMDMSVYRSLHIQRGAFVGAVSSDTRFAVRMAQSAGAAFCGGQGIFFTEMSGDGVAFLCGGGAITERHLSEGETIVLDTLSLLAWETSVKMSVRTAGGCLMCCCGSEGFFLTEMTGPGKVWIQPMPLVKMQKALAMLPPAVGGGGGGGSGGSGGGGGA